MSDLEDLVERVWQRQRPQVEERLHRVVSALRAGAVDPQAAVEAHKLAGALGTYGRPGSELAGRAERALRGEGSGEGLAAALLALVEQGALDRQEQAAGDEQQQGDPQR